MFGSRLEILIAVLALLSLAARTQSQTRIAATVPAKSTATHAKAQSVGGAGCTRSLEGSAVPEPKNLWSENGVLLVDLSFRSSVDSEELVRYCYVLPDGSESPNLRVHPGDTLILNFKNESVAASEGHASLARSHDHGSNNCGTSGTMSAGTTNLHFHGLVVPPVCHQDESLKTLIQPNTAAFEYRIAIPKSTPPGLYWYHPHPHGMSEEQVLGGASGALIVEGIEQANHHVANLPERVVIIRDQELPTAAVSGAKPDRNRPSKDLSINYVPVPYPNYPPAVFTTKPGEKQLWRVLNASADTYLDLQILYGKTPQNLAVIALDGIPIGFDDGTAHDRLLWKTHIPLPPASRAEFILVGPPEGVTGKLITKFVERGPAVDADAPAAAANVSVASAGQPNLTDQDDNDPERTLAVISAKNDAGQPAITLPSGPATSKSVPFPPLSKAMPVRTRKFYFSEKIIDPKDAKHGTLFFITEEGQTPATYDANATSPNVVVHQGDVEDWIIENRSNEPHAFHIHQAHFLVLERHGVPVEEPYLHDTINVPYWDSFTPVYPSLKLRMDFRDPTIVGTFPYHCHILQHEDGGMMGTIRVEPPPVSKEKAP